MAVNLENSFTKTEQNVMAAKPGEFQNYGAANHAKMRIIAD
jgi:hypothetical protein